MKTSDLREEWKMIICKHKWQSEYNEKENKEYATCSKCGLTREVCMYCENEQAFYSNYSVFDFNLNSKGILNISSEHNDDDQIKINYCPMCGRNLKEE